jgi:hypothetical protein
VGAFVVTKGLEERIDRMVELENAHRAACSEAGPRPAIGRDRREGLQIEFFGLRGVKHFDHGPLQRRKITLESPRRNFLRATEHRHVAAESVEVRRLRGVARDVA